MAPRCTMCRWQGSANLGSHPVFLGFPGRALASDLQLLLKEIKGCITVCQSFAFLRGVVFQQMPPHFWASPVLYSFTCLSSGKYSLMERRIPVPYLFIFQGFCFVFQFSSRRVSHALHRSVCGFWALHCCDSDLPAVPFCPGIPPFGWFCALSPHFVTEAINPPVPLWEQLRWCVCEGSRMAQTLSLPIIPLVRD